MLDAPGPMHENSQVGHYDELNYPGGEKTLEVWVNPTSTGATLQTIRQIVSKYGHNLPSERGYQLSLLADARVEFRLLKETLGNQNCRVVVSLKRAMTTQRGKRVPICLKRIGVHNPQTQAYCVLVWDGKELKLVSWNNAGDDYGDSEWTLK